MRTFGAGVFVLSLLGGGCSESTGPNHTNDRYALAEVGNLAIPVRVGDQTWLADTIRFGSRDAWTRTQVVVLHTEGSSPGSVRRDSEGFVTRQGRRLVLDFYCPPNANCVAPDTLRLSGSQLVRWENQYGSHADPGPEFEYIQIQ